MALPLAGRGGSRLANVTRNWRSLSRVASGHAGSAAAMPSYLSCARLDLSGDRTAAMRLLRANLAMQNGWDHPLTGVALLALGDLAIQTDDRRQPIHMISESTLVFARLQQFDWLAEAVQQLSRVSPLRPQSGTLDGLNQIAAWSRTRSHLAYAAAVASSAAVALKENIEVRWNR